MAIASRVLAQVALSMLMAAAQAQNELFEFGADVRVDSVTPAEGSVVGGQRLHIDGNGFNLEFFEGSNVVTLTNGVHERKCVVLEGACTVDCGSSKRIVCEIE